MSRRPPRSTPLYSSAASDVYKRQPLGTSAGSWLERRTAITIPHTPAHGPLRLGPPRQVAGEDEPAHQHLAVVGHPAPQQGRGTGERERRLRHEQHGRPAFHSTTAPRGG